MEKQSSILKEASLASPVPSSTAWSDKDRDLEKAAAESPHVPFHTRCMEWLKAPRSSKNSNDLEAKYPTIVRGLDDAPDGYHKVATFQSSDANFLLYRGFSYLHCRVLSALQYEINCLEDELDRLDRRDAKKGDGNRRLGCQENDDRCASNDRAQKGFSVLFKHTRPELLSLLKTKLLEYDELLLKTRDMTSLQRPATKDYNSVKSWFMNYEPLVQGEWKYVRRREDFITLRSGRECAGFDGFIERMLSGLDYHLARFDCHVIRNRFLTSELRAKTTDPDLLLYSPVRVDILVGFIITLLILILLVLPVVAMYELSNISQRASPFEAIGILVIFTLLFGTVMSTLTKAKRAELFAACAAYCGILVVFISNFSTQTVTIAAQS